MKILKNYIFYSLVFLIVCFYGVLHPRAYSLNDMKWLNRTSGDFPFTTQYSPYSYTLQYFMFSANDEKPNYYIVNACATGRLGFDISNITSGNIQYVGGIDLGTSCSVNNYNGSTWKFYFKLNNWSTDSSNSTIMYSIRVYNDVSWTVFVRFDSYIFTDTSDYDTLYQQQQNSQNLIASNNTNTQNIINNNNSNTQSIINNQNSNTQQQIESQTVCQEKIINKDDIYTIGRYLSSNGAEISYQYYGITDYIDVSNATSIKVFVESNYSNRYYCLYDENKNIISCDDESLTQNEIITTTNNTKYIRFSINIDANKPQFKINTCKNGNQALDDSINNLNDNIKDDDIGDSTSDAADFILDFDTNTFGLTGIITAPLNLIESLTSSTCSELRLPLPFLNNQYLVLPCMTSIYQQHFGIFFTMYQTITYGIIAYWVIVRIFNYVKDFKNPEHDEIEVVDL